MARSSAPTKSANGTANGHDTNGNGNGHGKKGKGYVQLTKGEKPTWQGLSIERRYTRPDVHPYDTVDWDLREATITNEHGKTVFEQKDLEFPKSLERPGHQRRGQQVLPRPPRARPNGNDQSSR